MNNQQNVRRTVKPKRAAEQQGTIATEQKNNTPRPKSVAAEPKKTAMKRKAMPERHASRPLIPEWKTAKVDPRPERTYIMKMSHDEFVEQFKDAKDVTTTGSDAGIEGLRNPTRGPIIAKKLFPDEISSWGEFGVPTEIEIARSLNHENIAPLIGAFKIKDGYIIAMPDTKGENLVEIELPEPWKIATPDRRTRWGYKPEEKPLTPYEIRYMIMYACRIAYDIAKALSYLHKDCLVVHQDVKLENIILTARGDGTLKAQLIDFGLARRYSNERKEFIVDGGTELYACKELYTGEPILGPEADIFSLGVLVHLLIFDIEPFKSKGHVETHLVELALPPTLDEPEYAALKEFLVNTLVKDPSKRWNIEQVLESDWIQQLY